MSTFPRNTTNPYASTAAFLSPSASTPSPIGLDRRTSNYSSYGFPHTPGPTTVNAYGSNPYGRGGSVVGDGRGSVSGPGAYGSGSSRGAFNVGRLVKRLFKFPQMDFELAVWEMVNLLFAPRKVWRSVWYRRQTKTTATPSDPALPYLLSFFLLLTSLAWSLAYASASFAQIARIAFTFVFVHCLGVCMVTATVYALVVPKALGPRGWAVGLGEKVGGRLVKAGRRRGLFAMEDGVGVGAEGLSWGFAFDIAIRAFLPLWVYLYVLQFLLLPVLASHHWPSTFLSNVLHLAAFSQSTYISFLGYNSIPSLTSTHLLLVPPLLAYLVLFIILTASGWNASFHLAPILWAGGGLRGVVGGSS